MSGSGLSACVCLLLMLLDVPGSVAAPNAVSTGKEFILGFMEIETQPDRNQRDVQLVIATVMEHNVTVNVTTPLFDPAWSAKVTVSRKRSATVSIPSTIRGVGLEQSKKAVHVVADAPVTVFGVNGEANKTGVYLAVPVNTLGSDYYAVTYKCNPELMIIGTEHDTTVIITLPNDPEIAVSTEEGAYLSGDALIITLDRFHTFHLPQDNAHADLTGCRIRADNPVAVLSGNRDSWMQAGGESDYLVEMMVPVRMWGKRYYLSRTPDRDDTGDVFRVVAAEDNTVLHLGDGTSNTLSNAGEFWDVDVEGTVHISLTSNKPVAVAMFSKSRKGNHDDPFYEDVAMALLMPEGLHRSGFAWGTMELGSSPVTDKSSYSLSVVVDKARVSGLVLDDEVDPAWAAVEDITGSEKVCVWRNVDAGAHSLYHTDPSVTLFALLSGVVKDDNDYHLVTYTWPAGFGTDVYHCNVTGDSRLRTFGGQRASLVVPCAYLVTRLRLTNLVYSAGVTFYPEIEVEVVAGNGQRTFNDRCYVTDVSIKVTFKTGQSDGPSNTYYTGESRIEQNTPWTSYTNESLQDRVDLSYDPNERLATLVITKTSLRVQFRLLQRNTHSLQGAPPGVFVQVDSYDLVYDQSVRFPETMCSTVDDEQSLIDHSDLHAEDVNATDRKLGLYAVMEHMQYNIPGGGQDPECPTFMGKFKMCSDDLKRRAFNECFGLLGQSGVVNCFQRAYGNDIRVTNATELCLDYVCSQNTVVCPTLEKFSKDCARVGRIVDLTSCP